ncbi:hypothetical protein ACWFRB_08760 [Rhodococcus sp. NPDC055112]
MLRAVVASCIGAAVAVPLLAGCSDAGDEHASPPAVTATPEEVVRSFIQAINAGDADAGQHLVADDRWSRLQPWFRTSLTGRHPHIDDLTIRNVSAITTAGTAAEGYQQGMSVPVTFTLSNADESMHDGRTTWGYVLGRNSDDDSWRILDNGV